MKVLVPVIADVIIVAMLTISATQAEEKMEWMKLLSTKVVDVDKETNLKTTTQCKSRVEMAVENRDVRVFVARGIGCTNLCRCINCANIMQARVAQVTPMKQRKRKRISFFLQKEKRKGVYGRPKSIYPFRDLEKSRNILFDSMPRGAVIP